MRSTAADGVRRIRKSSGGPLPSCVQRDCHAVDQRTAAVQNNRQIRKLFKNAGHNWFCPSRSRIQLDVDVDGPRRIRRTSGTLDGRDRFALVFAQRTARFHCVITLISPKGDENTFHGICEGRIGYEKRGQNGFGFDPVFVTQTGAGMAELSSTEKHQISHRGVAARKVAAHLMEKDRMTE